VSRPESTFRPLFVFLPCPPCLFRTLTESAAPPKHCLLVQLKLRITTSASSRSTCFTSPTTQRQTCRKRTDPRHSTLTEPLQRSHKYRNRHGSGSFSIVPMSSAAASEIDLTTHWRCFSLLVWANRLTPSSAWCDRSLAIFLHPIELRKP